MRYWQSGFFLCIVWHGTTLTCCGTIGSSRISVDSWNFSNNDYNYPIHGLAQSHSPNNQKALKKLLRIAHKSEGTYIPDLLHRNKKHYIGVDVLDNNGCTPLHSAAKCDRIKNIKTLLTYKASVDARDEEGNTPLHLAAMHGSCAAADVLIKHKATIETLNGANATAFHLAVMYNNVNCMMLLLQHKADPSSVDGDGNTPLHGAVRDGLHTVAAQLIKHKAIIDSPNRTRVTPLHLAAIHNNLACADLLLHQKANPSPLDSDGRTPLHFAATHGHALVAERLIGHKASVDAVDRDGNTPLRCAIADGKLELVRALCIAGANFARYKRVVEKPEVFAIFDEIDANRAPAISVLILREDGPLLALMPLAIVQIIDSYMWCSNLH